MFTFNKNRFYYLTVILSNCTYQGSVFITSDNLFSLANTIRNEFDEISNLEFRGIGSSKVRGNTNSLTLGVSAGYFNQNQGLNSIDASALRATIFSAVGDIPGLAFSEIRIEITLTGKEK